MSIEAMAAQCRQLNEAWDETVSAVRKVPEFEDFLQPKSIAALQQAAVSGPIIILLANDSACSALIVKASEDVQHVPLPALKLQILQQHYAELPRALSVRTFNVKDFLKGHGHGDISHDQSDLNTRLKMIREDRVNMTPNDIFRRLLADIWQIIVKPVFEVLKLKVSCHILSISWMIQGAPFSEVRQSLSFMVVSDWAICFCAYSCSRDL
jgi:hypothetical protein